MRLKGFRQGLLGFYRFLLGYRVDRDCGGLWVLEDFIDRVYRACRVHRVGILGYFNIFQAVQFTSGIEVQLGSSGLGFGSSEFSVSALAWRFRRTCCEH